MERTGRLDGQTNPQSSFREFIWDLTRFLVFSTEKIRNIQSCRGFDLLYDGNDRTGKALYQLWDAIAVSAVHYCKFFNVQVFGNHPAHFIDNLREKLNEEKLFGISLIPLFAHQFDSIGSCLTVFEDFGSLALGT